MSKKRRLKVEALERRRLNPIAPDVARDGTAEAESAVGLLKTFLMATQLSITSILFLIFYIQLLSWLGAVEWSQSRCNQLGTSGLKTTDLKYLLQERRVDSLETLSEQQLKSAVWMTGGLMEIEMEVLLEPNNNNNNSRWGIQRFDTWNEFQDGIQQQSVGVYLVLCSNDLERKVTELNLWRKFLYQLSKNGVNFVFVKCDADGDCDSPKVTLLPIWNRRGYKSWNSISYKGPLQPSDILQWITVTLSAFVFHKNSTTDVFSELYNSFPTAVVAHYTRPLPLSYAVLASELRDRVSFFWVETLDEYFPDRASLIVLSPGKHVTYHRDHFLNQNEIRWLLQLLVMDFDDFFELVALFLSSAALTVPLFAEGSIWQKLKATFWFIILCSLAIVLFLEWLDHYENSASQAIQFLITLLLKLINLYKPGMLLLFHLLAGHPLMELFVVMYALTVAFSTVISLFRFVPSNRSDSPEETSVIPVPSMTSTRSVSKTNVEILSRATTAMAKLSLNVNKMMGKFVYSTTKAVIKMPLDIATKIAIIPLNITKTTIKMPPDVAKTTTQVPSNDAKTTTQVPSDVPSNVLMTTKNADRRSGQKTEGPPATNGWTTTVTQSQSLKSQYSAPRPVPNKHDPVVLPSPSHRPMRPFHCPPLVDLFNGDLDKSSRQQVNRLKIPKIWILPVVSHKELRQLVLALQKLEACDQRSFESTSRTVPRCFYCGTDFEPTSEVVVLPCRDIFHPGCFNEWMSG